MRIPLVRTAEFVCIALALTAPASAQTTTRVSISSTGVQGNHASLSASISSDARCVAFSSGASNLVAGDTNGSDDIFFHDRVSGSTTLVSVDSFGVLGNASSFGPEVAADGRTVVFYSAASNLIASDTNGSFDAFSHVTFGSLQTSRWSVSGFPQYTEGNDDSTKCLRELGYFDSFQSRATNIVSVDVNGYQDVFVLSPFNAAKNLVSVSTSGVQGNGDSHVCAVAPCGAIAFRSVASNLVAGDTNGVEDIFVRELTPVPTTRRVSIGNGNVEANGPSSEATADYCAQLVAFSSRASNLVANDTNGAPDIFVRDGVTGVTTRVSVASNGAQANGPSSHPAISKYGHSVAFYSEASNLVPGDNNGHGDVFVRDLGAGTTTRLSTDSSGAEGNGDSGAEAIRISWDGRIVVFDSLANNLVANDTNGFRDIFVHDRGAPPGAYCTGGTSTHGCVASIMGNGTPSASSGSGFTITVLRVEALKQGVVFYGVNNAGFVWAPWAIGSTSLLCVKQPVQRTPTQNSGGLGGTCFGSFTLDWNAYIATHPNSLGVPFAAGQHVYAQAWYRDPPAPKTTNLSDALEFVVSP